MRISRRRWRQAARATGPRQRPQASAARHLTLMAVPCSPNIPVVGLFDEWSKYRPWTFVTIRKPANNLVNSLYYRRDRRKNVMLWAK